jgi:hypothetical protein
VCKCMQLRRLHVGRQHERPARLSGVVGLLAELWQSWEVQHMYRARISVLGLLVLQQRTYLRSIEHF